MGSFEILAEVAIGLAGFGTIAIVLARDSTRWDSADFFRTAALLLSSLGALFLALLPIGLATADLSDGLLWRISSAVMAAFLVAFSAILLRLRRQYLESALWFGPALFATVSITTGMNLFARFSIRAAFCSGRTRPARSSESSGFSCTLASCWCESSFCPPNRDSRVTRACSCQQTAGRSWIR